VGCFFESYYLHFFCENCWLRRFAAGWRSVRFVNEFLLCGECSSHFGDSAIDLSALLFRIILLVASRRFVWPLGSSSPVCVFLLCHVASRTYSPSCSCWPFILIVTYAHAGALSRSKTRPESTLGSFPFALLSPMLVLIPQTAAKLAPAVPLAPRMFARLGPTRPTPLSPIRPAVLVRLLHLHLQPIVCVHRSSLPCRYSPRTISSPSFWSRDRNCRYIWRRR
jgi:hypothetical protein